MSELRYGWLSVLVCGLCIVSSVARATDVERAASVDPEKDLISLHFDHAPDKDDGQSAAADRTILQSLYGADWIRSHVVAVSGTYGKNAPDFNVASDAVMDAVWNDCGGWIAAHQNRDRAVDELAGRWASTLRAGGDVWVKEGGQSDVTATTVQRMKELLPDVDTTRHIHVVQHADWNEAQTGDAALAYTKQHTDYIRIRDANAYLNVRGGDEAFVEAALAHPVYGPWWKAAFAYYPPGQRLDFSDTGELMRILGLGELGIDQFRKRFLESAGE